MSARKKGKVVVDRVQGGDGAITVESRLPDTTVSCLLLYATAVTRREWTVTLPSVDHPLLFNSSNQMAPFLQIEIEIRAKP